MSRRSDGAFVSMLYEVASARWWVGVGLAAVSYGSLHWVSTGPNPTTFTSTAMLKVVAIGAARTLQYVVPAALLLAALVSVFGRRKRARLLARVAAREEIGSLNDMSWREFEMLVGEMFRHQGYSVAETADGADGGVDLVVRKEGEVLLVQCKQWRARTVGVPVIRELYGAMAAQGAAGGFVVTSGRFTKPAEDFAQGRNLTLIGGPELHAMIRRTHPSPTASPAEGTRR